MLNPCRCGIWAAFLATAAVGPGCGLVQLSRPAPSKFNVYVVGEQVGQDCLNPEKRTATIKQNSAAADGCAIAAGADAALKSERLSTAKKYFRILYKNDKDASNPNAPADVARQIEADPAALAVVGHTASDTTRLALPLYAEAGIPLLMPVATSPEANHPAKRPAAEAARAGYFDVLANLLSDEHWDSTKREDNTLRLIPNDGYTQAPAIAFVARNLARGGKFVLVADSIDDKLYGTTLSKLVTASLKEAQDASAPLPRSLTLDKSHVEPVLQDYATAPLKDWVIADILSGDPKLIVFCGTKERAKALIDGVRKVCGKGKKDCPRFLLSDSSRTLTPVPEDANVYVMFPVPGGCASSACNQKDLSDLSAVSVYDGVQSYEMFAYDSILLLAHAIDEVKAAKQPLERRTVLEALRRTTTFPGAEVPYLFVDGENVDANYYVFSAGPSIVPGQACGVPNPRNSRSQSIYMTSDCTVLADELVAATGIHGEERQ